MRGRPVRSNPCQGEGTELGARRPALGGCLRPPCSTHPASSRGRLGPRLIGSGTHQTPWPCTGTPHPAPAHLLGRRGEEGVGALPAMVLEEAGGDDRGGSRAVQAVVGEDGVAVQGDLLGTATQVSGDVGRGDGQAPRRGLPLPLNPPGRGTRGHLESSFQVRDRKGRRAQGTWKPQKPSRAIRKTLRLGPQARNFGVPFILGQSCQPKHDKPMKFRAKTTLQEIQLLQMANK